MENILNQIKAEREYQIKKWGNEFDDKNGPYNWTAYITHYASRNLIGDPSGVSEEAFRVDMLKVATLAVAAIEALDRKAHD